MDTFLRMIRLIPYVIEAVKALEAAIPISGAGKEKLALILEIAKEAGELPELVTSVVNKVVALFNKLGIFKK